MMTAILFLLMLALLSAQDVGAETKTAKRLLPSCFVLIKVHPSGELTIVERLKGFGPQLQRPLNKLGRPYTSVAPFVEEPFMEVLRVTADGKPTSHSLHIDTHENRYVSITATDTSRPHHEYTLTYRARDRILFHNEVDKLIWDIWGISPGAGLHVSCAIELPSGAKISRLWSRLGHQTIGHRPVKQWINKKGTALFLGEEALGEREHFVVSIEWNKGIVTSDGSEQKVFWVQSVMWGIFALLLLICSALWLKYGKDPLPKVSTPLFYPPLGPDGKVLSPGAMAYIRNAAYLPSHGFAGILLNLAVQKLIDLSGTGTRKDPYVLQTSNEDLRRVAEADNKEKKTLPDDPDNENKHTSTQQSRHIWQGTLQRRCGFDTAERRSLLTIFSSVEIQDDTQPAAPQADVVAVQQSPPAPIRIDGNYSWLLAETRATASLALSQKYRDMWQLRGTIVFAMFMICYCSVTLVQALLWFLYGGNDIAVTLAIITFVGGLTATCYFSMKFIQRIWIKWQEMGTLNLVLVGLYALLFPVILLYDIILDKSMADFFLYDFMHMWQPLRILLWLGLMVYIFLLTRKPSEMLLTPLKLVGFLSLFFLAGGSCLNANDFAGSANLAFFGALLLPLCFMPIMKQPSTKAIEILADIEGFAMYIKAAEAHRLNFINPPERTPEEFHRIMPYAVALGLEEAWGEQFADMFKDIRFHGSSLEMLAEYDHRINGW